MARWTQFISPWSLAALVLWIVVLIVVASWAIPVFANVDGGGLQCNSDVCPTFTTVEWPPILLTGAVVATLAVGAIWAARNWLGRNPGPG